MSTEQEGTQPTPLNSLRQGDAPQDAQLSVGKSDIQIGGSVTGQNVAIGPQAQIHIVGAATQKNAANLDLELLRRALLDLYQQVGQVMLTPEQQMDLQGATHQTYLLAKQSEPKSEALVQQVQQLGTTFQQTGLAIERGSQLAGKIWHIAQVVGPLVGGGALAVARWFGLPLP